MIRLALFIALCAGLVQAQEGGTALQARAAAERLVQAATLLTDAGGASDQIAALTETVAAYEDGLASFREGLRRAAIRRQTIEADLAARSNEIATLLGVLQAMGRTPEPLLLLHPSGPLGTARSGMILADVTPALQAEADALRAQLAEMADIVTLQSDAAALLQQGLDGASAARAALAQAVQDRTDPPRRFTEDTEATATLIAATDTLSAFANGLAAIVDQDLGVDQPDATAQMGQLALPVPATILRGAGQADAAGTVRPGLVLATAAGALVTAPTAATVRFQGPLLDYGQVIILEPAPGTLFVLAGLDQVMVRTGEVVAPGAPLGLMGGSPPNVQAILTETTAGAGASRPETLYLEVRDQSGPIDPALWFLLE